jgi:Inward rectifier potassium channel transmembrane domain/Inward rectifier potassium channel C-terminal domain
MTINRRSSEKTNALEDFTNVDKQKPPRLIHRDLPFHQSRNKFNLNILSKEKYVGQLLYEDWFHFLLSLDIFAVSTLLILSWIVGILIFAWIYMGLDYLHRGTICRLMTPSDTRLTMNYGGYFAFSLETTTTVGYGLPNSVNSFFEYCPSLQTTIYLQMVWSMLYNTFFLALIFSRLSRPGNRGAQVIFSKTAVLAKDSSENWTFSVRVADLDASFPVVEAHVRMYARIESDFIEMRLLAPNDVIGGRLFLSWPSVLIHDIDVHSPLHPYCTRGKSHRFELPHGGLNKRQAEGYSGDNDRFACPVCGEPYGSLDRLKNHVLYNQSVEAHTNLTTEIGTHRAIPSEYLDPPPKATLEEIKAWFPEEVTVVVEGIDSIASGTFMAMQSYTLDDLTFDGQFADCIKFTKDLTEIDLRTFHLVTKSN